MNNFGVWYDDLQLARIAARQSRIIRDSRARSVLIGEGCAHASKVMVMASERLLTDGYDIPRQTYLPLLEELVLGGRLPVKPALVNFPVTLHDPCSLVRHMGLIEPQRHILKKVCPDFREMEPHGVNNYCCGGGGGFILITTPSFGDWRVEVSGRMKVKQILEAFDDVLDKPVKKYVCAPCVSCQMQIASLLERYGLTSRYNIHCGGLTELVLSAVPTIKHPLPL
jgi:Fe-S oxidoreductase